ncbi:MAG: dihydropteroate synthase [Gammaproteobacteria bacterium]|nr:dihydropteroate synthase [Gammaproteobacteria bacterium]
MGGTAAYGRRRRRAAARGGGGRAARGGGGARPRAAGIPPGSIVLDPGLGFAKTAGQSVALLGALPCLRASGFPLMVGPSRKSFLGELLGVAPKDRVVGTAAACVVAYRGGARLFRVHDVRPVVEALTVAHAVARTESR